MDATGSAPYKRQFPALKYRLIFLAALCLYLASCTLAAPCVDGWVDVPIGNISYSFDSIQVVPRRPDGTLVNDMYFGMRLLGVAELMKNGGTSCAYDPTTSQWTTNYVRRLSVLDDFSCSQETSQTVVQGDINQFSVRLQYKAAAYPDFELNITISVVDRDYSIPIVPGYNATYRADRVKFDADISLWPWARGDTSIALYSLVFFPGEFPDSIIEAYSGPGLRTMQYSRIGAAEPLNLTLSAETDFAGDGVHYQAASDPIYELRENLLAHHFGVGFCDGTIQRQFNTVTWDPTLSYLFGEPAGVPQETPSPTKKNDRPVWIPIVSTVLVVVFLAGLATAAYFIIKKSPTRTTMRSTGTSTRQEATPPAAAHQPSPSEPSSTPSRSTWAAAEKPASP